MRTELEHVGATSLSAVEFPSRTRNVQYTKTNPPSKYRISGSRALHDFVQTTADSRRERQAAQFRPVANSDDVAPESIVKFFGVSRFTLVANPDASNRNHYLRLAGCMISCMKKVFAKRIDCGCTVHPSLSSDAGIRSQIPKLPPQSTSTSRKVAHASCSIRTPANPG